MRRIIGGSVIFILLTSLITFRFIPQVLSYDNYISLILRKIIYISQILGGESNINFLIVATIIIFLPLLFKKPLYYFFKNLLGVELSIIGWLGIQGIQNLEKPIYITGLLTKDISLLSLSIVNKEISYIILGITLFAGVFLILTSYRFSSRLIGILINGIILSVKNTFEFVKSLFEYSENNFNYGNKQRSYSENYTTFGHNSRNTTKEKTTTFYSETKPYDKFIEITEIDIDDTPPKTFRDSTKNKYQQYDYPHNNPPSYHLENINDTNTTSQDEIRDVEIIEVEQIKSSKQTEKEYNFEENNVKDTVILHSEDGVFSGKYPPPIDLLDKPELDISNRTEELKEIEDTKRIIQDTFSEFKIDAVIEGVVRGPVVTMYEVRPKPGTKIAKIVNISDNLALNLATSRVRIVYPIPGKSVIGIEIPNKVRKTVRIREVIESKEYREGKFKLPLVIGVDIHGKPVVEDLTQMPHLLIAGSTGSGKSVYVNSIITGLLYSKKPDELKFIMIDLKIVELKTYNGIPHLLSPVITTPNLAKAVLEWLVEEMQYRYKKLESLGCRDITQYNAKISKIVDDEIEKLPYIVLIIDEYADLMMTSPKETEDYITRLAAMSRAVGIHLIIATQRPSVDVVTGLIKANFPARVAFRVASKVDSRTILDTIGAEKLLGKGDLLFMSPSHPTLIRVQGCYISNEEVERVVDYLIQQDSPNYIDLSSILESTPQDNDFEDYEDDEFSDELYNEAIRIVITEKKASASYLQRRLRIGYNRAARMIEKMEEQGIVGPQQGSKPREILVDESYLEKISKNTKQ